MNQDLHAFGKWCALTLLSCFWVLPSIAQIKESASYLQVGLTVGPSNFLGDLGGNMGRGTTFLKDNNIQMTKLTVGGFVSYHPNELFGFRLALNFGSLEGDDAIIKPKGGLEEARLNRNSNFKSRFTEVLFMAEVYPTVFLEYDSDDKIGKFRPYGVIGVGGLKFDPLGLDPLTGNWVRLQPLRTEGQGFAEYPDRAPYKLTTLNIPMGIGIKYYLSDNVDLSFEIIHRTTFSDYIDDVSTNYIDPALFANYLTASQANMAARLANKSRNNVYGPGDKRGNPNNNDAYYSAGFKLGIRLGSDSRYRNSTFCPIRF